jgi:hypothetical protein
MDGTGKCENRGCANLAIAEEERLMKMNEMGLGGQSEMGQNERKG